MTKISKNRVLLELIGEITTPKMSLKYAPKLVVKMMKSIVF